MAQNWRRWLLQEEFRSVTLSRGSHELIKQAADVTGLTMKQIADVGIQFFFNHVQARKLIENAKGVTLAEYEARVNAFDDMLLDLLGDKAAGDIALRGSGPHVPLKALLSGPAARHLKPPEDTKAQKIEGEARDVTPPPAEKFLTVAQAKAIARQQALLSEDEKKQAAATPSPRPRAAAIRATQTGRAYQRSRMSPAPAH